MKSINGVCVVGAGSIGCIYAGFLASVTTVKVLTRRKEHSISLQSHGLSVTGKFQRHATVEASVNPADLGKVDLIIVATKTFEVESAVRQLAGYFPDAMLMLIQNGMGCEKMAAQFGDWPIISAVTFMAGTRCSDSHVEYEVATPTWLAPWSKSTASIQDARSIAKLLTHSGLQAESFQDLLPAQWSKLIFNATVNSIAVATDLPFSGLFTQRNRLSDLGNLVFEAIREGKQVAEAHGITLLEDPWQMCLSAAAQVGKEHGDGRVPSMLADVRSRRPTEVDWITGELVSQANQAGIEAPIFRSLYRLVKAREAVLNPNTQAKL